MKKYAAILGTVVTASLLSTSALALDRANVSQKGSLLVFPKIDVTEGRNTVIRIQNDYSKNVYLKCYWKNGTKFHRDFEFQLTKFQPIWFEARGGTGSNGGVSPFPSQEQNDAYIETIKYSDIQLPQNAKQVGELKCWAVGSNGNDEIRWNHLAGSATVYDVNLGTAYEYNAESFRCLTGGNGAPCVKRHVGRLDLDGKEYDYCPKKLIGHFTPVGARFDNMGQDDWDLRTRNNDLTVATCNQDFRQDGIFHFTKLKFNVWNEHETKFTGAHQCIDSWYETYLEDIQNNGANFSYQTLKTTDARFKVRGMPSSVCDREEFHKDRKKYPAIKTEDAGLVGILSRLIQFGEGDYAVAGSNLHGLGLKSGFVAYDPHEDIEERAAR